MAAASEELEDFLLNPGVLLGPFDTFNDFQELFPSKYRTHPDVQLLYQAFKRHRRLLKQKVNKSIVNRYSTIQNATNQKKVGDHNLEEALQILEDKEEEVKERLKETQTDIASLEREIKRLTKSVDVNSFDDIVPEELRLEALLKLQDALRKR